MGYYNSRPKSNKERIRDAVEDINSRLMPYDSNQSTVTGYNDRPKYSIERIRDAVEEIDGKLTPEEQYVYKTIENVAVASFSDGADNAPIRTLKVAIDPIQDLHGYDSPWPAGGGKNKLLPELTNGSLTWNSVTLSVQDGEFRLNGTAGASGGRTSLVTKPFALPAGSYIISCVTTQMVLYDAENNIIANTLGTATVTLSEETTVYAGFNVIQNTQYKGVLKAQIESGSSATSYAPYANVCPITGHTAAGVETAGKNLFDENKFKDLPTDYEYTDGAYKCKAIQLTPNTTYTVSERAGTTDSDLILLINNQSHINASGYLDCRKTEDTKTFTTDDTGNLYIGVISYNDSGFNDRLALCKIQLELGSTATSYAPYTGNTYDITFPSEAGTVYGGTLNVTTGVLTVDRAKIEFNGTQQILVTDWQANENSVAWIYAYSLTNHIFPTALDTKPTFISDTCPVVTPREVIIGSSPELLEVGCYNANSIGIIFRTTDMSLTSESAINTYLAGNPVKLVYELAEPIEYQLDPVQISTLLGTNNVWADTGDIVKLKYPAIPDDED